MPAGFGSESVAGFLLECMAGFIGIRTREQNRGTIPTREVDLFMNDLAALPITVDDESHRRIYPDAHRLATAHRLTTHDAAYLELALRRRVPLATLDAELIAAAKAAGAAVFPTTGLQP